MAMNLRLEPAAAAALRRESERTGVSQQEILRRAVDAHLGLSRSVVAAPLPEWVEPARGQLRPVRRKLAPPPGRSLLDVLDDLRADRL